MVAFKFLVAAGLACIAAAHSGSHDTACVAPVTVTVTETVCGEPGVPASTPPAGPSYEAPPPPPASPVTSPQSTVTVPLSDPPVNTPTVVPPAPPAETVVPPVTPSGKVPSSDLPSSVASSTGVKTSTASAPGTTTVHSTTATGPSSSGSAPPVMTDGAALAVPYSGLGSLLAAGVAAMAVIA
ncbi:hypothetical protein C7974DRAFT_450303 [Boeremia exigua]|uniref:uncharacterized protein n=1 Tax=Boeremia exigua TaxID=749465 RepID=UPI001E8E26CC|nr:uncharacterized protein C7974DRAFT_450303 [Boeremia exigua]KAH6637421.1 hypothetical protein C7974DRAFT_450303 [Boeremia exigua]